ncbi:glycosyltransferase family 4 protein [bacterium]|nr:glycosyltransferase family 4 protein [bacterium]
MAATPKTMAQRVLIIVENLPVPLDRRVWQEATTLAAAGYSVSVICPKMPGFTAAHEVIDGVHVHRHPFPVDGSGAFTYALEYACSLFWEFVLSLRVWRTRGFDAIHACNPPDLIFLVAAFFKLFCRTRFLFDHHDLCPELYLAKRGRKGFTYRVLCVLERLTFRLADVSIATNESFKRVAIGRGGMKAEDVFIVRSGPDLSKVRPVPANPAWKCGRKFMVAYVGVMGPQDGVDLLVRGIAYLVHERGRRDTHFVLAGFGPELEHVRRLAAELLVQDFVTFPGRVAGGQFAEILCTADVGVAPDVVNEMNDKSTMNKIMEYMAFGKPVVLFEMTEGRFTAQEAAAYARPNDPRALMDEVTALLDDPARRARMGACGRERIEKKLQWSCEAPALRAAYGRLLGQ